MDVANYTFPSEGVNSALGRYELGSFLARDLQSEQTFVNFVDMTAKENLRLGQEVLVGDDRKAAVVDALTQTYACVMIKGSGMMMVEYEDVYTT